MRTDARVEFVTSSIKAQCAPHPRYPNGIDMDISGIM
jgi:hypothetical protein